MLIPQDYDLEARSHENLVNFLRMELELGSTFARSAELEASMNNWEHSARVRRYAETAIETIHKFDHRIKDPQTLQEIRLRTEELQAQISDLPTEPE